MIIVTTGVCMSVLFWLPLLHLLLVKVSYGDVSINILVRSSSGLHERPRKTSLQSHWRAPQPRIPPAENLGGGAERQRCCSSWVNGEEAGWVGVILIVLIHACIFKLTFSLV